MIIGKIKFSSFSLIVTFVCVALAGLALIPLLPVKLNPSRVLPGFTVQFGMNGTSARVVEMEATSKLESMLSRIKGIRGIYSTSGNGWGRVTVDLDKHADVDAVRFEASTIIRQTWSQLPQGVSYPYIRMKQPNEDASRPFMTFTLNAPSTPILIQQYAEDHIKNNLAQIPGIYKVDLSGATPMEWQLEYDSNQLSRLGITITDIRDAISRYYKKEFLGTYDVDKSASGRQWIRLALVPQEEMSVFDASCIFVTCSKGKLIRLDELITVKRVEEQPRSYFRINGLNSIYLSITAEETANQLKLSSLIKEKMEEMEKLLPAGYEIHSSYDATEFIHEELDKIYFRTGLTVLILLLFVLIITLNLRYLLLIVASLSVNIAVALIFYYLFGLEMQLYSLAGITVSLNLVIDNTIVMTDHLLHRRNMKAFVAILAATLTTMGALVIIFFLDEKIRLNLQDFAAVVIINLAVSLLVALFFVPAMIEKINLRKNKRRLFPSFLADRRQMHSLLMKRITVHLTRIYALLIRFLCRWRALVCLALILLFGLPVFLLPDRIEGEGRLAELYNKTLGTSYYKEKIKPEVDTYLGGSLRLFVQKVYEGSYFTRNEETVLYANANLPNGSTLEQMNALMKKMESYLSEFKEIKQFQTSIYSARRATISIYFTKKDQNSGFPYTLKANIVSKALHLGGGNWGVYGLQDQGFSNDVRENAGSFRVKMYGYNYDELYQWAEKLKEKLLEHRRIKEVLINSEFSWWKDDYQEFYFNLDKAKMAEQNVEPWILFNAIRPIFGRDMACGTVVTENGAEEIKLSSKQSKEYDVWAMQNIPYGNNSKAYKLSSLAAISKDQAPQEVAKENQQYRLCLQYEYIGSSEQGHKILDRDLKEFVKELPMGYTAKSESNFWGWGKKDNKQYLLLLIVVAIIFFITAILFNSLKQPLVILSVIPISYIGVFFTFYWFKLNFDQGGFASFVLLCGITVNASIYVLNEYNMIRRCYPRMSALRAYTKAWNAKVIPIFLTVISTMLGFVPFMVGIDKEAFWFPLAAGVIGGLVMSVIGIFFFLPVFALRRQTIISSK
ncbi:efflux RND transporter permease subunit [uncultured Bacteroides sp.]|uniref:efflux RND transporter permease subunit n=1 Tax=uncultured Bacteroides sp. TaxID=162156 RepID=UPI002AAAC105|nr:efflux RND transporter permease subunit [uncultured Bacteroides sp.]